ncbi:MAG TPA: WYL domain-containing transcriptional regulator [candidate division Zixibacteria bacterium]|nr:WYL domain-containing transcriptional regulator [candidate division Zixibacteria bacterium]
MGRDRPVLRAIKLLSLIENNKGGLRVADMARQLDAHPRAIYRDLQVLERLPVPIYQDRSGREVYWKLDPDFRKTLSIPVTLSELLAVYLAQDALRPLEGTVLYESLQSLFDKVRAGIPRSLFRELVDLRGAFVSDLPAQKEYRTHREFVEIVNEAIRERRTLRLVYHPRDQEPGERRIDPYAVHLRNGTLYVIGYCHVRKDVRTFVVDRMRKITMTGERFPAPVGFSLANYLRHSFGIFREDIVRVKVRFHKSLSRYLQERRWHPSQRNKKRTDGSLELTFEVAGTKEIKTWILGFGALATVLEPAALREEIVGELRKSLKGYGGR